MFRQDVASRLLLCVQALSEGPASCAAAAPHYLTNEEKVHLCVQAPLRASTAASSSAQCLQSLQSLSPRYAGAPKRALGYFVENIQSASDLRSRALLLQLCAVSDTQDPLAAADCFRAVPLTVEHDQAALMCRNISSTEVVEHVLLCYRILPKVWMSPSASGALLAAEESPAHTLCHGLTSRPQTEAVAKCAVDASKLSGLSLSRQQLAQLCSHETSREHVVLTCLTQLTQPVVLQALRAGSLVLPEQTLQQLCRPSTSAAGACVQALALHTLQHHYSVSGEVTAHICSSSHEVTSLLNCVATLKKRVLTTEDVERCYATPRRVSQVRLEGLQTPHSNTSQIVANQRFHLFFQLFDQYGARFQHAEHRYRLSINRDNAQGAVLWGAHSNHSDAGRLGFHHLLITQPGDLDLALSLEDQILYSARIHVQENPHYLGLTQCLYIFSQGVCTDHADDSAAHFPLLRSYLPAGTLDYLRHLRCLDKLELWQVKGYISLQGGLLLDYKIGIDAIWTGLSLPQQHMNMHARLGLLSGDSSSSPSKEMAKAVKRAYYKASLQWHPDRWVGYEQYAEVVREAFQLVHEAYETLMERYSNSTPRSRPVYA